MMQKRKGIIKVAKTALVRGNGIQSLSEGNHLRWEKEQFLHHNRIEGWLHVYKC